MKVMSLNEFVEAKEKLSTIVESNRDYEFEDTVYQTYFSEYCTNEEFDIAMSEISESSVELSEEEITELNEEFFAVEDAEETFESIAGRVGKGAGYLASKVGGVAKAVGGPGSAAAGAKAGFAGKISTTGKIAAFIIGFLALRKLIAIVKRKAAIKKMLAAETDPAKKAALKDKLSVLSSAEVKELAKRKEAQAKASAKAEFKTPEEKAKFDAKMADLKEKEASLKDELAKAKQG